MAQHCEFCGTEVDPNSRLTYRRVVGWEHPRDAGGTNALALRQIQDRFACFSCIDKQRRGISLGQTTLV